jgi:Glycosyl transferase family 2.
MSKFEVLCVTMHQNDFSKIEEMNIKSNVVFANQADRHSYEETCFYDNKYKAKMITTNLRGVGKNRNMALIYAESEICLLSDDDVKYNDNYQEIICSAFKKLPNADCIIFNLSTNSSERQQYVNKKIKKCNIFTRMPYGAVRIAFKLESIKKTNIWFSTLFGGGCIFPSGEDSIFIKNILKNKLNVYKHTDFIGEIDMNVSSWYDGMNEKYYYGKGAFYSNLYKRSYFIWFIYISIMTRNKSKISFKQRLIWLKNGRNGYKKLLSYNEYITRNL